MSSGIQTTTGMQYPRADPRHVQFPYMQVPPPPPPDAPPGAEGFHLPTVQCIEAVVRVIAMAISWYIGWLSGGTPGSRKGRDQFETVELSQVISVALDLLAPNIAAVDARLSYAPPAPTVFLQGNRLRLGGGGPHAQLPTATQ